MAEAKRWRKAVVISLVLHGVMFTVIGWLAAKTFAAHEVPEQYVELELVGEVAGGGGGGGTAGNTVPGTVAVNEIPAVPAFMTKTDAPVSVREQMPTAQASADNMSVLSTEPGTESTAASAIFVPQGGGSGTGTGSDYGTGYGTGSGSGTGTGTGTGSGTGNGVGNGSGIISPGILSQVEPTYPERARQAGLEGTVVLKIQILENGRPGHVGVYRSSGSDLLDDAAIDAVRQWRFIPAKNRASGQTIVCYTTMPVVFRLKA